MHPDFAGTCAEFRQTHTRDKRCVGMSFSRPGLYHLSSVCTCNPPHRVCVLSLYNDRAAGWAWVGERSAL